jgi:signal transduction histidine kinase
LLPGETQPEHTIDLGESYPLNRIHLHAVDQSDTVPQVYIGNHAIPKELEIIGANQPDFSDAVKLLHYHQESLEETKPILMLSFPKTNCRYIKLIAERAEDVSDKEWNFQKMGFAEVECLADGKNVALNKPFSHNFVIRPNDSNRKLSALTDGRNLYGKILPLRQWMEELARRHELEQERPKVEAARQLAYQHQKIRLQWVSLLAAALAAGMLIIVLIDRIIHLRKIAQIKERFAADLHDELGANVHTIGLLSDAAQDSHENEADWKMLHMRIRDLTERTGIAIRHCTNMLEAKKLHLSIAKDMKRVAQRNMANFEHTMTIKGESHLANLKPQTRVDLLLFYKECLVNISRHSGATRFATELIADANGLCLTISDNGKGISEQPDDKMPASLKRRARLIKATLKVETFPNEGTRIILTYKHKRFMWK